MTCIKCGAALRGDQVFCPECGAEVQLVANYNPTEEELMGLDMNLVAPDITGMEEEDGKDSSGKTGLSKKTRIIIPIVAAICIIALIVMGVNIFLNNDYGHQFSQAQSAFNSGDYKSAVEHARSASAINTKSTEARWLLARAYVLSGSFDGALETIKEILALTSNDAVEYDTGMALFIDAKEYKSAAALLDTTTDVNIRQKYNMYLATVPEADTEGGSLNHEPSVVLTTEGKSKIYYTVDKADASTGVMYTEPVKITSGKNTLRAISINQYGVQSEEKVIEFDITPGIPDMPEILPAGVNITKGTEITITAPEDCKIYYTWDGSEPTSQSYEYTAPMEAPEGNNILSVIVVDKYGQSSNVAKKNYIVN